MAHSLPGTPGNPALSASVLHGQEMELTVVTYPMLDATGEKVLFNTEYIRQGPKGSPVLLHNKTVKTYNVLEDQMIQVNNIWELDKLIDRLMSARSFMRTGEL